MNQYTYHRQKIKIISDQFKEHIANKNSKTVRFSHRGTHSTRVQDISQNSSIDISSFSEILEIDAKRMIAIVEPNVSMQELVNTCLKHGLIPKVVMEFPDITCGGGINGAALEASSYKYGQFNDSCIELECVLGDGSIITANEQTNADLFYGISGSYGSLALVSLVTLSLIPALPYVNVVLTPISSNEVVEHLEKKMNEDRPDYIDAIIFNSKKACIITGNFSSHIQNQVVTFSLPRNDWFYLFVQEMIDSDGIATITVPITDFIFRYDRGAFWMGKHAFELFRTPFNRFTRKILDPLMHTTTMYKALHRSNAAQNFFIQDFYIPLSKTSDFIEFSRKYVDIFPLWLCPIKSTKTPQILSPHYLDEDMLIDVGIWGNIPKGKNILEVNKEFENHVYKIGGKKMLYAETFYNQDEFWKIYDKNSYDKLRKKYKTTGVFPDVWEKTHVKHRYTINKWKGLISTIFELLINKFTVR